MSARRRGTNPRRPHSASSKTSATSKASRAKSIATGRSSSTGDHVEYRARGEMEADPSFKQLIPYCLFRWTDADGTPHLFEYQRGGGSGEARLHAKRSVGVGGHISSIDAEVGPSHHVYREGMRRELEEEVIIDTPYKETVVGLINDDETPVGQVHLGMVHLCDVEEPNVRPREADILGARFTPVADILTRSTNSKAGRKSPCGRCSAKATGGQAIASLCTIAISVHSPLAV